jgi:hypothetical protein
MIGRIERAGFRIDGVHGDDAGGAWPDEADVWFVLATARLARPRARS